MSLLHITIEFGSPFCTRSFLAHSLFEQLASHCDVFDLVSLPS